MIGVAALRKFGRRKKRRGGMCVEGVSRHVWTWWLKIRVCTCACGGGIRESVFCVAWSGIGMNQVTWKREKTGERIRGRRKTDRPSELTTGPS